jgi:plastocyanin
MKIIVLFLSLLLSGFLIQSCQNNQPASSPIGSPPKVTPVSGNLSATPTPSSTSGIAVTVTYGGSYNFVPSSITITHGQSVVWDSSFNINHTLYIDGFSGSATPVAGCGTALLNTISFPVTQVFSTPGTYNFHCGNHSGCNSSQCGVCTGGFGMIGSVVVN